MGQVEDRRWAAFIAELALMPDVVDRLLAEHVDDGGGFCRQCRTPGRGTPAIEYPCSLATMAADARRQLRTVPLRTVLLDPDSDPASAPLLMRRR